MLTLNDGRKELYQWDTGRTATVKVECDVVHFSCLNYGNAPAVKVKGGVVEIPNELLMLGADVYAWAFVVDVDGGYTKQEQVLKVNKRPKPSDYVYTKTEVVTIETAVNDALEKAKESGDFKGDKGDKGEDGKDGVDGKTPVKGVDYFTESDKTEIAKELGDALAKQSEAIDEVKETIADISNHSIMDQSDFESGKMITYQNPIKHDFENGKVSQPIELKVGMKIKVYTPSYSTIAVISLYDNGDYIPIVQGTNSASEYNWYTYTATEDCQVVVTLAYKFEDSKVEKYFVIDEIKEQLELEIDTLSAEISNIQNQLNGTTVYPNTEFEAYISGKYINPNNNVLETATTFALTKPITVKKDDVIVSASAGFTITAAIAYCNETMTSFDTVVANASNTAITEYTYIAEKDGYICFGYNADFGGYFSVTRTNNSADEEIVSELNNFVCADFEPIGIPTFDNGYYSYNSNKLNDVYSHKVFDVVGGEIYKVSGYSCQNVMAVVLTDGTNVVDYYPKEEASTETYGSFKFEIPQNATKMYVNRIVKGTTNREYYVSVCKKKGLTFKHHENKKLAIIGDSLSVPFSGVTLPYWKLLDAHDNFTVENFARSGHGYYHDTDKTYSFWRQAERVTADTEVCLIFGSFNDMEDYNTGHMGNVSDTSEATICGCMNKTFATLLANNVGLKIGVVFPTPWGKGYNSSGNYHPTKEDAEEYISKLRAICEKRGLPYLDLFHTSGLRPWDDAFDDMYYNNSDACHPNNKGHEEYIYPHIREFVKTLV